jgi:hypothetical protein
MNIYTHTDDEGLGSADAFDELLGADALRSRGNPGATEHPETAANRTPADTADSAS